MKTKKLLIILLIIGSALVLAGLVMRKDVWFGIVWYWGILLMKNILDYFDETRKRP